ncbi:hypothetical protein D3C85_1278270 [compost metagenome]
MTMPAQGRWNERTRATGAPTLESGEGGTIPGMTSKEMLTDEELGVLASEWRMKALQGDLHARGIAHEYEREMRRRAGAPLTNYDTLDLRPLELRAATQRRWWRFWRVG